MKKSIYEKYNIDFERIRDVVEPYIVDFYGKDKKEEISKRLDNVVLNNYFTLEDIKSFVRKNKEVKRRALSLEFLEKLDSNITFSEEEKNKLSFDVDEYSNVLKDKEKNVLDDLFDNFSDTFSENSFAPIYSCFGDANLTEELTDYQQEVIKNKTCKVLNVLGLDINKENYEEIFSKESSKEYIQKAKELKETALNLREEFFEFSSQFLEEEKYFEECEKLKQELNLEEIKEYYKEILPYTNDEEKENITQALNSGFNDPYRFLNKADKNNIYLGSSLSLAGKIESFSKETKEKLLDKKVFFKDQILKEQKECLSNFKEVEPSEKVVEKIKSIREEHLKKLQNNVYLKTSSYENSVKFIEDLNLILNDEFNLGFMKNGAICCAPNITNDKNEEKIKSILHIPLYNDAKMLSEYKDTMFIHELLHAVELTGKRLDEETYEFKSGFDILEEKIKGADVVEKQEEKEDKRAVELFSENIHQRNAMEVVKKMHEDGVYLFNDPYTAKIRGGTTYEHLNIVTNRFYENYNEKINEARFSETITPLINEVGENNFYNLNDVVNEYAKIPYINMCYDLAQGKITERTIKNETLYKESENICDDIEKNIKLKQEKNKKIDDDMIR